LYGILTIGDGLVSQIPSLLVAISAGVLVTRAGGKAPKDPPKYLTASGNNVGAQIGSQFFSHPKALKVAGVLVFLFALVPGFPKPQLFALALFLIGLGYALSKVANAPEDVDYKKDLSITSLAATTPKIPKKPLTQGTAYREEFAPVIPIILDISPQMGETFRYDVFNEELASLRRALYFDLGVPFPGINLRPSPTLPGLSYIMNLNEIPLSRGTLEINKVLVIDNEDNLLLLGIKAFKGPDFIQGLNSLWVSEDKITILEKMGLKFLNHPKIVSYHLSLILSRHASNFLGLQETKYLLDKMEERAPDLVRELTRLLPLHRFTEILQRLVQEEVSIRDLRAIMESLIEWVPKEKDSIMLVEYVRGSLRRQISYKYTVGSNILPVIIIDQGVEETIRKSIRQTSAGTFISLDPQVTKSFLSDLSKAHKGVKGHLSGGRCAVLASIDIRRYVRRLIEADHYELPVISYQELTSEITVQPVDKIKL
jgi:type III secretion protein V